MGCLPSQQQAAGVHRQPAPLAGVERLPGSAPELNPTEALWGNLKGKGGELAYLAGDTLEEVIGPPSVASTGFAARPSAVFVSSSLRTRPVVATVTLYGKTLYHLGGQIG
jgi:hypothetical protein